MLDEVSPASSGAVMVEQTLAENSPLRKPFFAEAATDPNASDAPLSKPFQHGTSMTLSDYSFDIAKSGLMEKLANTPKEPVIAGGVCGVLGGAAGVGARYAYAGLETAVIGISQLPAAVIMGTLGGGEAAVGSMDVTRTMMQEASTITAAKLVTPTLVGIGIGCAIGVGGYYGYKWLKSELSTKHSA